MPDRNPIDRVFAALAEATRRAMLEQLSAGPRSVSSLAEPFDMTLAAVMQHIRVLEGCGLVQTEKVGRVRTCRINDEGLSLAQQWLNDRRAAWDRRLDRLGEVLSQIGHA